MDDIKGAKYVGVRAPIFDPKATGINMHVVCVDHPNGAWEAIYCHTQGQAEAIEQLQSLRHEIMTKTHEHTMEIWKKVVATEVFQDLKHGKYRDILNLLQDGEISVGKAAEAIAERAAGIEPRLPESTLTDDRSWKERYDALKAEFDENLKITG